MWNMAFTGTQNGMTSFQLDGISSLMFSVIKKHKLIVRHGLCIGADTQFHNIVKSHNGYVIGHPCTIEAKQSLLECDEMMPVKLPLDRNKDMVSESNWVLAAPATQREMVRSGTWATIREARRLKKPLTIIFPDGLIQSENGGY